MGSSDEGTANDATGETQTRVVDESPRADSLVGAGHAATLGRYTILEKVGEGATGVVYSAYDPELDRRVALGLTIGGIPGVLVAAFLVTSLPLVAARWLVVGVLISTSALMWRSALQATV